MTGLERVRALLAGEPCDHLPVQPMVMLYAAKYAGIPFREYCCDGRKMAEAQLLTAREFQLDALLTCSDPAREVCDIAGDASVEWFDDQPPAIHEHRAALQDKARLQEFAVPAPEQPGRMHDRIVGIQAMRQAVGDNTSIVGWVEGPLALAAELRGINAIMVDFVDDPAFVHRLLAYTA
ncbi:MAG TPA: uroporphyrinogen decarboxylase family protein, partial [Armatimonadota bacterium]